MEGRVRHRCLPAFSAGADRRPGSPWEESQRWGRHHRESLETASIAWADRGRLI